MEKGRTNDHHGRHQNDRTSGECGKELRRFDDAADHQHTAAQHGYQSRRQLVCDEEEDHHEQYS